MAAAVLDPRRPAQVLRSVMLQELEGCEGLDAALLRLRVRCAADPVALWHLRPLLMQAVAGERGESVARRGMGSVDQVFRQHWPDVPISRPAPLR